MEDVAAVSIEPLVLNHSPREEVCCNCGIIQPDVPDDQLECAIDLDTLPAEMIEDLNSSLSLEEKAFFLLHRREFHVWQPWLEKYNCRICACGVNLSKQGALKKI